jgi:copper chaperone
METIILIAPDISCEHCQTAIEREVGALAGVQSCSVDITSQHVTVQYDPSAVTRQGIVEVMEEEGYPVAGGA